MDGMRCARATACGMRCAVLEETKGTVHTYVSFVNWLAVYTCFLEGYIFELRISYGYYDNLTLMALGGCCVQDIP